MVTCEQWQPAVMLQSSQRQSSMGVTFHADTYVSQVVDFPGQARPNDFFGNRSAHTCQVGNTP